jgi:hypothetical protein
MLRIASTAAPKCKSDFAEISIASVTGLTVALIAMFLCYLQLATHGKRSNDFVVFWATGQQLAHHGNPYDPAAMERIEREVGLPAESGAFFMRNPPWALPLVLPLGFTQVQSGALLWSLVLLGCQIASGWLIWQMFERPQNNTHWLAISFAPSLICLAMGQTALFALLGLVLFLRFYGTHPFLAGLALWLCALKPHLFLPFGVVLLAWVITSKRYRILAGSALALVISCAVTSLIFPSAWSAYNQMMHAPEIAKEAIPCLSVAMRLWISPQKIWLQFLPAGLACAWALAYYWRRRETWDWIRDGSLLTLISLVLAPYCWVYDQSIAISALLQGAYTTRSRPLLVFLALVNIPIFGGLIWGFKPASAFYLWISPIWLAWYLIAGVFGPKGSNNTKVIAIGNSIEGPALSLNDETVQSAR